jgi:hypothetical protein
MPSGACHAMDEDAASLLATNDADGEGDRQSCRVVHLFISTTSSAGNDDNNDADDNDFI